MLFLTDLVNSGSVFRGDHRELLDDRGDLPYLVRRGGAEIALRLQPGRRWTGWAVDATGHRLRPVALRSDESGFRFDASTAPGRGGIALAYELSAQP